MGTAASIGTSEELRELIISRYPFSKLLTSSSRDELNVYCLSYGFSKERPHVNNELYTQKQLVDIIIACRAGLGNITPLIEKIISMNINEGFFKSIEDEFQGYLNLQALRSNFYNLFSSNYKHTILPQQLSQENKFLDRPFDFSYILEVMEKIAGSIQNTKNSNKFFDKISSYLKQATPPCCIKFNNNEQMKHIINCPKICWRGLTSNGEYLFVLTGRSEIMMFPLFSYGSIGDPIIILTSVDFKYNTTAIASRKTLKVYIKNNIHKFPIKSLLLAKQGEIVDPITNLSIEQLGIVSDGIARISITKKLQISVKTRPKKPFTYNAQLHLGSNPLNNLAPSFINKEDDMTKLPIATTGNYLIFVYNRNGRSIFRVFSAVTGRHCLDIENECDKIHSICYDATNRCWFMLVSNSHTTFTLTRYDHPGAENPAAFGITPFFESTFGHSPFSRLTEAFVNTVIHMTGSYIITPELIPGEGQLGHFLESFSKLLDVPLGALSQGFRNAFVEMIKGLSVILDRSLDFCVSEHSEDIMSHVMFILQKLPDNIACAIFFGHLDIFFNEVSFDNIELLVLFVNRLHGSIEIIRALRQLEKCPNLEKIPFRVVNALSSVLTKLRTTEGNYPLIMRSVLFIHQRRLVDAVHATLSQNTFQEIEFRLHMRGDPYNQRDIDNYADYLQLIVTEFDFMLTTSNSVAGLMNSMLYRILSNFLRLSISLSKFHTVAHLECALLSVIMRSVNEFEMRVVQKSETEHVMFSEFVKSITYIYGRFAATLVMGGGMSDFESKCNYLLRGNVGKFNSETISQLSSSELDTETKKIVKKVEPLMKNVYNYKPAMNRKLNDEIKKLDIISLAAIAKHSGMLEEFMVSESEEEVNKLETFTAQQKRVIDQMLRIRSYYRSLGQNGEEKNSKDVITRCLMLLRMDSEFSSGENPIQLCGNFITSKFDPKTVAAIIYQQKTRIQTSLVGFALIMRDFQTISSKVFDMFIIHALSLIPNFDGLAVITKITKLTEEQLTTVNEFFRILLDLFVRTGNQELAIIIYRFFRDMEAIEEIRRPFVRMAILAYIETESPVLFAVIMSIIPKMSEMLDCHLSEETSLGYTTILGEFFQSCPAPEEIVQKLRHRYFCCRSEIDMRTIGAALVHAYNKSGDLENAVSFFFEICLFVAANSSQVIRTQYVAEAITTGRQLLLCDDLRPAIQERIMKMEWILENDLILAGICIIINASVIIGGAYYPAKVTSKGQSSDIYILASETKGQYIGLSRPFYPDVKARNIEPNANTSITFVSPTVPPKTIGMFDWILDGFYKVKQMRAFVQAAYSKALSHMVTEKSFAEKLNEEQLKELTGCLVTVGDESSVIKRISRVQQTKQYEPFGYFSRIHRDQSIVDAFISPILKDDTIAQFTVTMVDIKEFKGYIGIVSSPDVYSFVRFRTVSIPQGRVYPDDKFVEVMPHTRQISFTVNATAKQFTFDKAMIDFPEGESFRVIILIHMSHTIEVACDGNCFDFNKSNTINSMVLPGVSNRRLLYNVPEWAISDDIPKDWKTINSSPLKIFDPPAHAKESCRVKVHKHLPPLHFEFGCTCSPALIEDEIDTCFMLLAHKANTMSALRIASNNIRKFDPDTITKIFSLLCILTEKFDIDKFMNYKFPFPLDAPAWKISSHSRMGIEKELKKLLCDIVSQEGFCEYIFKSIAAAMWDTTTHLNARPHPYTQYYSIDQTATIPGIEIRSPCIVCTPNYYGVITNFFTTKDGAVLYSPTVADPGAGMLRFTEHVRGHDVSLISAAFYTNEWMIGTPFELLVLITNYIYTCVSIDEQSRARHLAMDMYISRSPFLIPYIPDLLEALQIIIPITPLSNDKQTRAQLLLIGMRLKEMSDTRIESVYASERTVLTSQMAAEISPHFPEFFGSAMPAPKATTIKLPISPVDPGALYGDLVEHLQVLRHLSHRYSSLSGFPLWEALPLWVRISGAWAIEGDVVPPQVIYLPDNIIHFQNPSEVEMVIRIRPRQKIPTESMMAISESSFFEDPNYMLGKEIFNEIRSCAANLYLSLIGVKNGWDAMDVSFKTTADNVKNDGTLIELEPSKFREEFVHDMREMAVEWTEEDTQTLLNALPKSALSLKTFATTDSIARSSGLCQRFSPNVVALKALIIHHYNYIKNTHQGIAPDLITSMAKLTSRDDAADQILGSIKNSGERDFADISVNRKLAQQLIMEGSGRYQQSLVSQVGSIFKKLRMSQMQCPGRPWRVIFVGEEAIDAGGPARELLTGYAESIFEPTTQLCAELDGRIFVPVAKDREQDLRGVGIYLGIILRHRLPQELPFAPFVWKYLAGEEIKDEDVLAADQTLSMHLENVRQALMSEGESSQMWTATDWSGAQCVLPGHAENERVLPDMVEQYVAETIRFRVAQTLPCLKAIRRGFRDNTGLRTHPLLTGALFSHMAQGSAVITVRQLRQIAIVSNYSGLDDPVVVRFFAAVDRMTPEQRRLLLKFITTLTRLPPLPSFNIRIDRMKRSSPDDFLPVAATCFNKIYLPEYTSVDACYSKLITAITMCSTMERK